MANTYDIDININVDSTDLEAASDSLQQLEADAENLNSSASDVSDTMTDAGQSFEDAGAKASDAGDQMSDMGDKAQEGADKVEESASNTSSSIDSLTQAAVGVGAAMGLASMVDTAGNIEASWDRLSITFGGVTDGMRNSINEAASATGRSGGSIRQYFNSMGIAGIKNTDLLNQSFQALSGKAFQTGADVNQLGNLVQKMALSGNAGARQLTSLGISTDQLGAAMGVAGDKASKAFKELSQEERLRVLTKAMGDGSAANEAYKNSWEGVKDQAGNALAALAGAVGSTILPLLVPAITTAKEAVLTFKDIFSSLPGPVQTTIGIVGGGILAFTALGGAMAVITPIVGAITASIGTLVSIITAFTGAETLGAAASNLLALALGEESAAAIIGEGAFLGLTAAEWAALWPVFAIVGAVALLGAAFYKIGEWLGWWNDLGSMIDSIRAGVTRLWNAFVNSKVVQAYIGMVKAEFNMLYSFIKPILDWLSDTWNSIFGETGGSAPDVIGAIISAFTVLDNVLSGIINTITAVMTGEMSLYDAVVLVGQNISNYSMAFWGMIGNLVLQGLTNLLTMVGTGLLNIFNRVTQWKLNLANQARATITSFISNIISGLASLPGRFGSALQNVISTVTTWGSQLVQKAVQIVTDFANTIANGVRNALNNIPGVDMGFTGDAGFDYGFTGSTLNNSLANTVSNNTSRVTNNFSINGIIEESASEYIVNAVNENIRKQNLIRGV